MDSARKTSVSRRLILKVFRPTILCLIFSTLSLIAVSLPAQEVLTNESVVGMVEAGLPEGVIVAKIRSSETKFDLSTDTLITLKRAGVSDNVMMAMIQKQTPGVSSSPPVSTETMAGASTYPAPMYPPYGGAPGFSQPSFPAPSQAQGIPPGPVPPPPAAGFPPYQAGPAYPSATPPPGSPPSQPYGVAPEQDGQAGGLLGALKGFFEALQGLGDRSATPASPSGPASPPMDTSGYSPYPGGYPGPAPAPYSSAPMPEPGIPQMSESPPSAYPQPSQGTTDQIAQGDQRGKLGVRFGMMTPEAAQKLGLPNVEGAVISEVVPGSAAAGAGLRERDLLTHMNGQRVRSSQDVIAGVEPRTRGEATRLRIIRDGRTMDITVPTDSAFAVSPGISPPAPSAIPPQPPAAQEPRQPARSQPASRIGSVAGTYRCWSYNVGGAGKRCTSPPLVLNADGTYQMSSERGTYAVSGDQIALSESKIRGPGRLQAGNQVVFEYAYQGQQHTATYLRQDSSSAPPSSAESESRSAMRYVAVDLKIRFAPSDGSVGWINGAALIPQGEKAGPETLAVTDGKQMVSASFRSVETGRVYTLFVSSGLDRRPVGTVDLRNASGPVALTFDVPAPQRDRDRLDPPRAGPGASPPPKAGPAYQPPSSRPAPVPKASTESEAAGKPCNPNLPRYAQPGCKE